MIASSLINFVSRTSMKRRTMARTAGLPAHAIDNQESAMSKQSGKRHRYELVRGDDADFIAYQRESGDGTWQVVSVWMIPQTSFRQS